MFTLRKENYFLYILSFIFFIVGFVFLFSELIPILRIIIFFICIGGSIRLFFTFPVSVNILEDKLILNYGFNVSKSLYWFNIKEIQCINVISYSRIVIYTKLFSYYLEITKESDEDEKLFDLLNDEWFKYR